MFKSTEELAAKAKSLNHDRQGKPRRHPLTASEESMPKTEIVVAETATEAPIQISKAELQALIASSAKAAVDAALANKSDGTAMGEAFAKAIAPTLEGLSANQKQVVDSVLDKTGRNQNTMVSWPAISVFNPLGDLEHPRPTFKDKNGKYRKTLFCGCDMGENIERMTAEEIDAFNAIDESCEVKDRNGWIANISKNGSTEVLEVRLPMGDNDVTRHLPNLTSILFEFKHNTRMPDVNKMLSKMLNKAVDPELFMANLQKLLEQPTA